MPKTDDDMDGDDNLFAVRNAALLDAVVLDSMCVTDMVQYVLDSTAPMSWLRQDITAQEVMDLHDRVQDSSTPDSRTRSIKCRRFSHALKSDCGASSERRPAVRVHGRRHRPLTALNSIPFHFALRIADPKQVAAFVPLLQDADYDWICTFERRTVRPCQVSTASAGIRSGRTM